VRCYTKLIPEILKVWAEKTEVTFGDGRKGLIPLADLIRLSSREPEQQREWYNEKMGLTVAQPDGDSAEGEDGGEGGEGDDSPAIMKPKAKDIKEKLKALVAAQKDEPKEDRKGKISALKWVLGDVKTL
jgi:hypothetical protein